MSSYTVRMHEEIEERAENLAEMAAPEYVASLYTVIDRWIDEFTTLSGDEAQMFRGRLKRATLRKVGQRLLAEASAEDA